MIREDYILRMIEEIGVLVRRILNRSVSKESIEADLEAATQQWIGLPADMLLSLSAEDAYRLLEDSDRMIVEKSYLMGEVCRAKGIGAESAEAEFGFFENALFFYNKCSGLVDEKLQIEIDQRLSELNSTLQANPRPARINPKGESLQPPPLQAPVGPSRTKKQPKKRSGVAFWYAIAACLIGSIAYTLFAQDDIEITDRNWEFQQNRVLANFTIVNNTHEERLIRLKLSLESYKIGSINSGYTFLGGVEREYRVGPDLSKPISEQFESPGNSSGPNRSLSIEILSSHPVNAH